MISFWLTVIAAQDLPSGTGDILKTLGPFSAAVLIGGFWVKDLLAQRKDAQKREQLLSDRNVEMSERTLPLLTEVARLLAEVSDELRRSREH